MEGADLTRLRSERPGGMEFLRETLTRDAAGTWGRSLLKRLVYKRADMAHADPSAPATHVCWPLMRGAVTQDGTKEHRQEFKSSWNWGVMGGGGGGGKDPGETESRMRRRKGLDFFKKKRDVPQGLWVFLPALGLTVDHWGCQI